MAEVCHGQTGRMGGVGIFRMGELKGRAVVGFYWTLPVPWAGFTALPKDVDAAAKISQTVRYQREVVRRYVRNEGGRLVREAVFLEIRPDRGDDAIRSDLEKAAAICRKEGAQLMLVDFAEVQGWRSHAPLKEWLKAAGVDYRLLPPDPLEGEWSFDPAAHFADWRERDTHWRVEKNARINRAAARAAQLRAEGLSFPKTAEAMNAEGIATPTGKSWTGDNLRKLLISMP